MLKDANGVYSLEHVSAITSAVTAEKQLVAVLHFVGGQFIQTLIKYEEAIAAWMGPQAVAPTPPASTQSSV